MDRDNSGAVSAGSQQAPSGDELPGRDEEGWDDPLMIEVGIVLAVEGSRITMLPVNLTNEQAIGYLRAFVHETYSTEGLTRQ